MTTIVTLLVCLAANPAVCETVFPNSVHVDGSPMTFFECLGTSGQSAAVEWLREHPGYVIRRVQCSVSNNDKLTRERLAQPEA